MIGGNTIAIIQIKTTSKRNAIGEAIESWEDVAQLTGFLDLASGDAKHTVYNAKIQESTHIFLCDYGCIEACDIGWKWDEFDFLNSFTNNYTDEKIPLVSENARMIINNKHYDVKYIDDPMELHEHLEIYLKYTGGQ